MFELENSITLDELFLLYRACGNETNLQMKMMAASQGADVDFDEDWYDPTPIQPVGASEIAQIPIGLGYEAN